MESDDPYPQALDKGNLDDAFKIASTMAEMDGYAAAHSRQSYGVCVVGPCWTASWYTATYILYVWCCAVMVTHAHAIALAALPAAVPPPFRMVGLRQVRMIGFAFAHAQHRVVG